MTNRNKYNTSFFACVGRAYMRTESTYIGCFKIPLGNFLVIESALILIGFTLPSEHSLIYPAAYVFPIAWWIHALIFVIPGFIINFGANLYEERAFAKIMRTNK